MKTNSIFIYSIIIIFSPLLGKLAKRLLDYYKLYKEYEKKNTLLNLLYRLTPREFEIWCSEYLSSLGYTNILLTSIGPDGGKDIICSKNNEKYYVECKKYNINNSINIDIIEKLLGVMVADNIVNGILITTSKLSYEAKDFLSKIEAPYNIQIISALELDYSYDDFILQTN